jgi:RNA-binding protein
MYIRGMDSRLTVDDEGVTHAGGIVYRHHQGRLEFLLVRAKPAPHDWVLPKGRIEAGETAAACARREVQEEAGVDAVPIAFLASDRYTTPLGKVVFVALFLMRHVADVPPSDAREHGWFSVADTLRLMPFAPTQAIVGMAEAAVASAAATMDRMPPALTARQRAILKGRAHALEPTVQIGQSGVSDAVVNETDRALTAHGLIKVRIGGADRQERSAIADQLCRRTGAAAVQSVGRILVLWRPRPDDELPA